VQTRTQKIFGLVFAEENTNGYIMQLAISPDGRKLAFVETKGPWKAAFYWCNIEGNRRVFVENVYATDAISWNSDSSVFAYTSLHAPRDFERVAIKTYDTQSGTENTVVDTGANAYPTFSPVDRGLIAYLRIAKRKYFLHLFDFKNETSSLLVPEPLAGDESWCWNSNGQEIFYCIKVEESFLVRSVDISTFSSRDILKLVSAPDEMQFISEGQFLSILDSSGEIILATADGVVLERIHPATGLYKGLQWQNSERVAFLACENDKSQKCDLAVSNDRLKTFNRIAVGLRRPYIEESLMDWLLEHSLIYHNGSVISVVDENGHHVRQILSLPLSSPESD